MAMMLVGIDGSGHLDKDFGEDGVVRLNELGVAYQAILDHKGMIVVK